MKLRTKPLRLRAFLLAEVIVAMALISFMVVTLMQGFLFCFFSQKMARENLQATQIMVSKTESLRLKSWEQVMDMVTNKVQFIERVNGVDYRGTIAVSPAVCITSSYSNDMRAVTVYLNWATGNLGRRRAMHTLASKGTTTL